MNSLIKCMKNTFHNVLFKYFRCANTSMTYRGGCDIVWNGLYYKTFDIWCFYFKLQVILHVILSYMHIFFALSEKTIIQFIFIYYNDHHCIS